MSQSLSFAFGRHERLKSDVLISRLYTQGKSISKYPLRLTYLIHDPTFYTDSSVKYSINASKKGLRLAVKRNRMKRLLREVIRHQKHPLISNVENHSICLSLSVVYVGAHLCDFETLERAYLKLQKRLMDAIKSDVESDRSEAGDLPPGISTNSSQ